MHQAPHVTVPGCCCCMPLLYNHLIDSYQYVRKNALLATKGGYICIPLPPLSPPLCMILKVIRTEDGWVWLVRLHIRMHYGITKLVLG